MRSGWRATVAVLSCIAATAPAMAQPATTAKNRQAGALVSKAFAKSEAGDHEGAIELFRQAFALAPSPVLLSHIGTELMKSGNAADALRYFCMYLENDPKGPSAEYAASQAKRLQLQLGNKSPEACAAPAAPELPPPAAAPVAEPVAPTPPVAAVVVAPTQTSALTYAGIGAGAAGLIAVGIGIYEGVQARDISNQINARGEDGNWRDDIRDLQVRGQRYEDRQIAFLIGGGVLIATGTVLYILGRPSASEQPAKTSVRVTPTTNGVAVLGRF